MSANTACRELVNTLYVFCELRLFTKVIKTGCLTKLTQELPREIQIIRASAAALFNLAPPAAAIHLLGEKCTKKDMPVA